MTKDVKAIGILGLVVLATGLPFVRRAYFVDDYYFVTMAKGILHNPWRPYDFKSDDAGIGNVGWERGQRPRMVNPPLFHYYLAGVIKLFGDAPWKLRMSSLIFSLLALLSMYFLGKRFVPDPLTPALLMAVTPAYWLTSYSLLIDSALVAFLLFSLLVFVIGHERRHLGWIAASGFLMGLTMMVKYFGVIVVALALVWQVLDPERRKWWPSYIACGGFLAVQLAWGAWNMVTYGRSHFLAALPRGMETPSLIMWAQKALVLSSFMGGTLIFVLAGPILLWRVSKPWRIGMAGLAASLFMLFYSTGGGFGLQQSIQLSILVTGALAFILVAGRLISTSDPTHRFLMLWMMGGFLELIIVMPWTAGRYLLCVLPALCWIFVIMAERLCSLRLVRVTLGLTAVAGFFLAHADYVQAGAIVSLARMLNTRQAELQTIAPRPPSHWYYLADTFDGSQPYLLPLGWENVLPHQKLKSGDLFLRSYYRKSSYWDVRGEMKHYRMVARYEVRSWNPLRVMDVPASAGFYASCWGALPWAITRHPLEHFELYQAGSD